MKQKFGLHAQTKKEKGSERGKEKEKEKEGKGKKKKKGKGSQEGWAKEIFGAKKKFRPLNQRSGDHILPSP